MTTETDRCVVEVYWRPGCGFCSRMRTALAEAGIDATWHNIWEDPEAAGFVRSVATGNETVPTVRVADDVMVAPRPRQVIDRLVQTDPDLVADPRRWPPRRIAHWATVAVALGVAYSVARAGHEALSLVMYGAALAAHLGFRHLRTARGRRIEGRPVPSAPTEAERSVGPQGSRRNLPTTTGDATMARAIWNDTVLAESDDTVVVEGNHYFPAESLDRDRFRPSDHRSACPWKGDASYFDIVVDGDVNPAAAWTYPDPKPAAAEIAGRVAFWRGIRVEADPTREAS